MNRMEKIKPEQNSTWMQWREPKFQSSPCLLSIMTLSIKGLYMTLSLNGNQHSNVPLGLGKTFRFPLRPFSVLPAGGGGWVRRGGDGSGGGNGKYVWRERKTYTLIYPAPCTIMLIVIILSVVMLSVVSPQNITEMTKSQQPLK